MVQAMMAEVSGPANEPLPEEDEEDEEEEKEERTSSKVKVRFWHHKNMYMVTAELLHGIQRS